MSSIVKGPSTSIGPILYFLSVGLPSPHTFASRAVIMQPRPTRLLFHPLIAVEAEGCWPHSNLPQPSRCSPSAIVVANLSYLLSSSPKPPPFSRSLHPLVTLHLARRPSPLHLLLLRRAFSIPLPAAASRRRNPSKATHRPYPYRTFLVAGIRVV